MNLLLQSDPSNLEFTLGRMYADGRFLCYTLEDVVRERPGVEVCDWKVRGCTAIPQGTYKVTLEDSPKFGPETLTVQGVPGFTAIRMHAGNTEDDTEGCPLLGLAVGPNGIVGGTSRPAVSLVKAAVRNALDAGELVTLQIQRAGL